MKRCLNLILHAFLIVGLAAAMSSAAVAQQKTAKQCRDEWRANEAANKAKGITESAFVKECRAGTAAAQPTTPAAAAPTAAPTATAQKTVRQCRDEWRANEAENKKNGITESAFVKDCRAGTTTARPAAAPSSPAPARTAAPAPATAPASRPTPTTGAAPTGANQFTSEAAAKSHCRSDQVVWVNTGSHVYHFSGHQDYGHTKQGAYMCERDATAAGNRAAQNEKHP